MTKSLYGRTWLIMSLIGLFYFFFIFQDGYRGYLLLEGIKEITKMGLDSAFETASNYIKNAINFN